MLRSAGRSDRRDALGKQQQKRQAMHDEIKDIDRAGQRSCQQHLQLLPEMRLRHEWGQAKSQAQNYQHRIRQ